MEKASRILAINPGSTSTKIAFYENENIIFTKSISHSTDEIKQYEVISEQYEFRKKIIMDTVSEYGIVLSEIGNGTEIRL